MKRLILVLLIFVTLDSFAQLKVKEGSFKKVENCVILDKRYDDNNNPMALIRIYTENILPEQKRDFFFDSDFGTNLEPSIAESGEIELYATYTVKKIKLTHNFFSPLDIVIPFDLEGNACYELILQGPGQQPTPTPTPVQLKKYHLIVKADQADATIYIDGTPMNIGEASKLVDEGTTHTYRIECDMYHAETGSVTVNEKTVINKTLRPAFGYINISTSPEQGAKVSVDGKYIGVSPITTDKLASGTHTVRVMKEMYKMKEQTFTVNDGQTTNANITMTANFVNVTVNADSQSDIYVDEEYKGKGRWTGRLSDGSHIFEARKTNHKASKKTIDLVLGKNETITLEAPKPINGSIEINSSPMEANIYIDGKSYGTTPNYINEIIIGTHELKLEKQGCTTITKSITIKEGETLSVNEKLQTGKEIVIKTDKRGDKIYVDNNYVGLSPVMTSLAFGSHTIKAERDGKTMSKNIEVSHVETHGRESSDKEEYVLAFSSNETFTVNGVSFTMIKVEGGTFRMGATSEQGGDANSDEIPVHSVTLSDYYIGETEVTQELWEAVMGSNPSKFKGSQKPVECVSWYDCKEFITKLNRLTGKNFRLPTESEWEYAARGGNKSKGYKYSGSNTIDDVAWCYENSGDSGLDGSIWDDDKLKQNNCRTHNVKTKSPNELGIYDMSGNVWEWCEDWYGDYSRGSQTNPAGPSTGSYRVERGGSWCDRASGCRVSNRSNNYPDCRRGSLGLRLCLY